MRLAHEIPPPSRNVASGSNLLFRWNKEDLSQFVLVDPLNHGWTATFEKGDLYLPPHVHLTAPKRTEVGPVFLLVEGLASSDHVVSALHTVMPHTTHEVGIVDRYGGAHEYVASVWTIGKEGAALQSGTMVDGVWLPSLFSTAQFPGYVLRTVSLANKGLHGAGLGEVTGFGISTVAPEYLMKDPTIGFMIKGVTAPEDAVSFKLFELTAHLAGGVDA